MIDSDSEVNAMTLAFTAKLGFSTQQTNIGAQKINIFPLKTYGMTIVRFSIQDELGKIRFFKGIFLLADTSMDVFLGMSILSLSNAEVQYDMRNLNWRIYSIAEALPKTRRVELIDKHKFARAALDEYSETFVVHVAALEAHELAIHPSQAPLLAALEQDKAPTEIPLEYVNYADVFSPDLAIELPENTGINEHAIELIEGKWSPY